MDRQHCIWNASFRFGKLRSIMSSSPQLKEVYPEQDELLFCYYISLEQVTLI